MYIKLSMYLCFKWRSYLLILMGGKSITRVIGRGTFSDPNGTRFARSHFPAQKSHEQNFQGPPLPIALEMDLFPSESLHPVPFK
jgi:hypothetical protein